MVFDEARGDASSYDRLRDALVIHGSGDRFAGDWILEATTWVWTSTGGWAEADSP